MSSLDHPAVAKVANALAEAGHGGAADGIRVLPDEVRTAAQAAEALGVEVGAIANSVVFRAVFDDGAPAEAELASESENMERAEPLLALTSGAHRAGITRLAELAGAHRVDKADPSFVKHRTGQVIGGVAPVGHAQPLTTLVDESLRAYEVVWAAAGHAKAVFPTTFSDLVALTGGSAADVTGS